MIFKVLNHPIPSENNNTNNGQIFILGSTLKYKNMIKDLSFISGLQPNLAKFFLGMIASLTAKKQISKKTKNTNIPCLLLLVGSTGFRAIPKMWVQPLGHSLVLGPFHSPGSPWGLYLTQQRSFFCINCTKLNSTDLEHITRHPTTSLTKSLI